jgi:sodium-dependent dicarboxylate transporter 2/3/5
MKRLITAAAGLVLLIIPLFLPLEGLSPAGRITCGLFLFAAVYWMFAPIPIYATSVTVILFQLALLSNASPLVEFFGFPYASADAPSADKFTGTLAHPILILFLGGFMLAAGAQKYHLEKNLVRVFLSPCKSPQLLLSGVLGVCALLSAFMSNTATTAMMFAVLIPVLAALEIDDPLRISLALAVPIGANIGGIITPIGTPPNAVALGALAEQGIRVSFASWMVIGAPLALVSLVFVTIVLLKMFPPKAKKIELNMTGSFDSSAKAVMLYVVAGLTIVLWATESVHEIPSSVVAFLPIALLPALGIIGTNEIRGISWEVLWLVAGGISLGYSLKDSGLATWMIGLVNWTSLGNTGVILGFLLLSVIMANFLSHTVTTSLLVPIAISLGTSGVLAGPSSLAVIAIGIAIASSYGMSLPISTPPNAIAIASGAVETPQMAKVGLVMAIFGLVVIGGLAIFLWPLLLK